MSEHQKKLFQQTFHIMYVFFFSAWALKNYTMPIALFATIFITVLLEDFVDWVLKKF